ncbi:MAG: hypothetical protein AMXMBFR78_31460, partial [Rubrivivax sp.]
RGSSCGRASGWGRWGGGPVSPWAGCARWSTPACARSSS